METFGALWVPFGPFGTSFGRPGERNEVPSVLKSDFMDIMKTLIFFRFFLVFGSLGSPLELQMDALGAYRTHFWPNVGYLVSLFGGLVCMIDF